MFTYGRCYAPYTVELNICGIEADDDECYYDYATRRMTLFTDEDGVRQVIVMDQPECLKKPFVFKTIRIDILVRRPLSL